MVTRYVSLGSSFDLKTWASAVQRECSEHGEGFVAAYIEVSIRTLEIWCSDWMVDREFPYPSMSNFLKFCNEFGYDPRDFFAVEE